MIDKASVFAERFKSNPQVLQATVLGQGTDPSLDPYTALRALQLIKESNAMMMARQAQQPTSAPSIASQAVAPQGLAGMLPMGAPAGQMPQMAQAPQAPAMQASGGLAGMYTPEEDFAEGGIVAFNGEDGSLVTPAVSANPLADYAAEMGEGAPSTSALARAQEALEKYMNFEPKEMTEKEQEAFLDRYMARVRKAGGADIYAPAREKLTAREAALVGDRKTGEGMALLTAAGKILKGRNLAEGASEALPAYAQQLGEVKRAEQSEKRAIEQMNFALADAERKERMGDARGAQAALEAARKFQQDANRAQGDKLRYGADIAARTVGYSKVNKGAGSGGAKEQPLDRVTAAMSDKLIEMKAKDPNDPQIPILEKKIQGRKEILGTGKEGPTAAARASAQLTAAQNRKVMDKLADWEDSTEATKARKLGNYNDLYQTMYDKYVQEAMAGVTTATPAATTTKPGTVLNYDANGKRIN